jgi:hypothetical protein
MMISAAQRKKTQRKSTIMEIRTIKNIMMKMVDVREFSNVLDEEGEKKS